jgi:hypothetical protein
MFTFAPTAAVPTFDQVMARQKDFLKAFVDLKVEGYKSYTKAIDNATFSYFTTYTKQMEKIVIGLGDNAKEAIDFDLVEAATKVYNDKK